MNKTKLVLGVLIIAIGTAVLFTSNTVWGLRGLAEMALGVYLIRRS